jgi:hypothetical protein
MRQGSSLSEGLLMCLSSRDHHACQVSNLDLNCTHKLFLYVQRYEYSEFFILYEPEVYAVFSIVHYNTRRCWDIICVRGASAFHFIRCEKKSSRSPKLYVTIDKGDQDQVITNDPTQSQRKAFYLSMMSASLVLPRQLQMRPGITFSQVCVVRSSTESVSYLVMKKVEVSSRSKD